MLPDLDGFEVLRRLRAKGVDAPVLFLTARADTADRVRGLTAGGDDYIVKPFALEELVARVHVALRRRGGAPAPTGRHQVHDLVLDEDQHRVWRGDHEVHLTATEFILLRCLLVNAGGSSPGADPRPRVAVRLRRGGAIIESFVVDAAQEGRRQRPQADPHRARRRLHDPGAVMTLRRRLVVAASALAVGPARRGLRRSCSCSGPSSWPASTRQLAALAQNPRAILLASARRRGDRHHPTPAGLSDIWVGRMSADGTLTPVLTPQSDPVLVPLLGPGEKVGDAAGARHGIR